MNTHEITSYQSNTDDVTPNTDGVASYTDDVTTNAIRICSLHEIEQKYFNSNTALGERYPLLEDISDISQRSELTSTYVFEQRLMSEKIRAAEKPEEIMLELLLVMSVLEEKTEQKDVVLDQFGRVNFLLPRQIKLRRILFNNPHLDVVNNNTSLPDDDKWKEWGNKFLQANVFDGKSKDLDEDFLAGKNNTEGQAAKVSTKGTRSKKTSVMSYDEIDSIKHNFKSFSDFTKAVTLLRSWSFINSGKQWCYSFLFPFGPDCLFSEVKKDHGFNFNYLSFAGTLLFSMMQRSHSKQNFSIVCEGLHKRFLDSNNVFNKLVQNIEGVYAERNIDDFRKDLADPTVKREIYSTNQNVVRTGTRVTQSIYLPFKYHRVFDQVTDDFANVLNLDNPLNQRDLFNALSIVSTLNLVVYYLEVGQALNALCGIENDIDMVVECCHVNGKHLRRLSTARLVTNEDLLKQSIGNMMSLYIKDMFPDCTAETKLSRAEFSSIMNALQSSFLFGSKFDEFCLFDDCCEVIEEQAATSDQSQQNAEVKANFGLMQNKVLSFVENGGSNFTGLHRSFCRYIGLASKFSTRAYRYVMPDELVRVLVLTTVDKQERLMLLDDFLAKLYRKYHIVIGPKEGSKYCSSDNKWSSGVEKSLFNCNLEYFKMQLSRLGFLISLSDTASYVKNPYLDERRA